MTVKTLYQKLKIGLERAKEMPEYKDFGEFKILIDGEEAIVGGVAEHSETKELIFFLSSKKVGSEIWHKPITEQ